MIHEIQRFFSSRVSLGGSAAYNPRRGIYVSRRRIYAAGVNTAAPYFFPSDAQCALHGTQTGRGAPFWFIPVQQVPAHRPVHLGRPLATGQTKDSKYYARLWP